MIQFDGIVNLREIQLLAHQYKIPRRVELFVYHPIPGEPQPAIVDETILESLEFRRVGHVSFDPNERTKFASRELKSVYVDFLASMLKLQIDKCFANKLNNFRQAGIVSLRCMVGGQPVPVPIPAPVPVSEVQIKQSQPQHAEPVVQPKTKPAAPEGTLPELIALEREKARAVAEEDFDTALRLKTAIERLKAISSQLADLAEKKKEAVQREDYEAAKKYKMEIERLKGSVLPPAPRQPRPEQSPEAPVAAEKKVTFRLVPERVKPAPTQSGEETEEVAHAGASQEELKNDLPAQAAATPPIEEDLAGSSAFDETVIPALLKRRQGDQAANVPQEPEEGPPAKREQAEPLSEAVLILAEPYKAVFTMPLLELLFSKHYYLREEGLETIGKEVTSGSFSKVTKAEPEKVLKAVFGIVLHMVQSKIISLAGKALSLLLQAMTAYKVDKKSAVITACTMEYVLDGLLDRLGESNAAVSSKVEETLLGLLKQNAVSAPTMLTQLIKTGKKALVRQMLKRIALGTQILKQFSAEAKEAKMEDVAGFAVSAVNHISREIRLAGYTMLVEAYRVAGEKVGMYLQDMTAAQKKTLDEELKKALGAGTGLKLKVDEEAKAEEATKTKKVSETAKKQTTPKKKTK